MELRKIFIELLYCGNKLFYGIAVVYIRNNKFCDVTFFIIKFTAPHSEFFNVAQWLYKASKWFKHDILLIV